MTMTNASAKHTQNCSNESQPFNGIDAVAAAVDWVQELLVVTPTGELSYTSVVAILIEPGQVISQIRTEGIC